MSFQVGSKKVSGLYVGSSAIGSAYRGSQLVYSKAADTVLYVNSTGNVLGSAVALDVNGNVLATVTAMDGVGSAAIPGTPYSVNTMFSAGDYYATTVDQEGVGTPTITWTRNGRYGTATALYTGGNITLNCNGVLNAFTASGQFATDVTARWGWYMPARVNMVQKAVGTYYGDVSASRTLRSYVFTAAGSFGTYNKTQNALAGTYSAVSAYIRQVGSSYRTSSYGGFGYTMVTKGLKTIWEGNYGNGAYNARAWATTTKTGTATADTWAPGTSIDSNGNGVTLMIGAKYGASSIYTVTTGTWTLTGIAK